MTHEHKPGQNVQHYQISCSNKTNTSIEIQGKEFLGEKRQVQNTLSFRLLQVLRTIIITIFPYNFAQQKVRKIFKSES